MSVDGEEMNCRREDRQMDGQVEVRPPSPRLLFGSSGNVGGSPGTRPAPGRRPPQHDVWECHPESDRNIVGLYLTNQGPASPFTPKAPTVEEKQNECFILSTSSL